MSKPKPLPMSLRLTPEMMARLEAAAKSVQLGRQTLAQRAIEAAIEAVETSGGSLVIPVKLEVADIPVSKASVSDKLAAKDAQVRASRDFLKKNQKLSSSKIGTPGKKLAHDVAKALDETGAKPLPPGQTEPPTDVVAGAKAHKPSKQPPKKSP